MPSTRTDSTLWYNVGECGPLGYAVPNWSDDVATNNVTIRELVDLMGSNLSLIMHGDDAALRYPPSMNTIWRIHQLYIRVGAILQARTKNENEMLFESIHATPALEVFRVYPVPYFKVRNPWIKRWGELALRCIGEMMQHTENRRSDEITSNFSKVVGSYMKRIYDNMAMELFNIPREETKKSTFLLTDAQLATYNPSAFVTSTERIDTVSPMRDILTEDTMSVIRAGILVTQLPNLTPYPADVLDGTSIYNPDLIGTGGTGMTSATTTSNVPTVNMPTGTP